jgi:glycine/serine hydroxymethyltransferase
MKHFESTLSKIAEKVFQEKDWKQAQKIFVDYLETTNVKDKDKMIKAVKALNNINAIHRYTANALLKFEGLGVGTTKSTTSGVGETTAVIEQPEI